MTVERGMYSSVTSLAVAKAYAAIDKLANEVAHIEGENQELKGRVADLEAQAARQNAEFDSLLLDCDKAARLNEAQAAADAKVVEAIKQLPLEHLFALVAAQDSRWDEAESALINAENVLAGLDAALAARKPSE